MTCWRRLRDWQAVGVWDDLHRVLLDELREADEIDWSRIVDSSFLRGAGGRAKNRAESHRPGQAG